MPYINGLYATQAQRLALKKVFRRIQSADDQFTKPGYREFLGSVQGLVGEARDYDYETLMVPFVGNTWLGIEPDGYTHS